jgi:hypothetical protein
MSLSVFANFRIDSEERLLRMKDSFESFRNAEIDKWVVNARGQFSSDALCYLSERLGDKLVQSSIETSDGWIYDSRLLFAEISTNFVLFWIEDHICMCGHSQINAVVNEMALERIDYLGYSWYGMGDFVAEFDGIHKKECENLFLLNYDNLNNKLRQSNSQRLIGSKSYIVSVCGIFSKSLFEKILFCRRPYIRRWPKETPFDFEKRWDDLYILPIKYAVPKFELFASIDDDNKHKGSSLISRGLYPNRISRNELVDIRNNYLVNDELRFIRGILRRLPLPQAIKDYLKRLSYHF